MILSKEELRKMSTWIRDVLNPHIDRDDRDVLDHDTLRRLRTFFTALKSTPIGIEDIRYSHIDRALIKICDVQTKWPVDLVKRAEEVLQALEQSVGPLRKLKVDTLSTHGPHLEGEVKRGGRLEKVLVHVAQDDHKSRKNNWTATCDNPERAYAFGHIGFEVGDWWINTAYAYQDGIIDDSQDGVTADEDGAYAILLRNDQEIDSGRSDMVVYKATSTDRGKFMLMRNLNSRVCVRVLRSWRSESEWAPRAGLRYDGLYAVIGYGVKLNTIQKDEWVYTFRLRREDGQPSLEKALRHPTAEEYSGWKAYKKDKEGREEARVSPTTPLAELVSPVKDMVKRPAEEDEGYFSVLGQQ